MIPVVAGPTIGQTTEVETKANITSATWEIDFSTGRVKGLVDGLGSHAAGNPHGADDA